MKLEDCIAALHAKLFQLYDHGGLTNRTAKEVFLELMRPPGASVCGSLEHHLEAIRDAVRLAREFPDKGRQFPLFPEIRLLNDEEAARVLLLAILKNNRMAPEHVSCCEARLLDAYAQLIGCYENREYWESIADHQNIEIARDASDRRITEEIMRTY
jgi:hypothetical protein